MDSLPDLLQAELGRIHTEHNEIIIDVKSQDEAVLTLRSRDKVYLVYVTIGAFVHELEPVTYAMKVEAWDVVNNCEATSLIERVNAPTDVPANDVTRLSAVCEGVLKWFSENESELEDAVSPKSPKNNTKKTKGKSPTNNESKHSSKLPSMKTAEDVINRIEWDSSLPKENFLVGYLDRFLGVIEKPYTSFNWTMDLCDAGPKDVAIPQHRIVYFKYKTAIVWHKEDRLDLIFGSTGQEKEIHSIIEKLGSNPFNFEVYAQDYTRAEIVTDVYHVDWAKPTPVELEEDYSSQDTTAPETAETSEKISPPNYFFALRVSSESLFTFALEFQKKYFHKFPSMQKLNRADVTHLHITLGTIRIDRVREYELAIQLMMDCLDLNLLEPVTLPVTAKLSPNLQCFNKRVISIPVISDQLTQLVEKLLLVAEDYGLKLSGNIKPFNAHITLMKTRSSEGAVDETFLSSPECPTIPEEELTFSRVLLCSMSEKQEDGFYRVVSEF